MLKLKTPLKKGSKLLINAWSFYDWANSVYSLVITTAIFPLYYASIFSNVNYITVFEFEVKNTAMISFITAFAFIIIVLIIPILSGIADYIENKKIFMKFFVYMGSISCVLLYWFEIENIFTSLFFYFLALIGFWSSLVFYNSFLPDIAYPHQQDKTSALGYSMGYIGSVILLLINLIMVTNPHWFGIEGSFEEASIQAMKYSFITVGLWWFLFSQISFYYLPGKKISKKISKKILFKGFNELEIVWNEIKLNIDLKKFLFAFFVYSTALQTVMLVATYFGEAEIIWENLSQKTMGLIISILLIQIVAVLGSLLASKSSKIFGNLKTLIFINILWAILCFVAFYITTPSQFYIIAGFVGLVMGALQPLSRSTFSKFLPKTKDTASYFSFYGIAEKIAIIIGMIMFGLIDQITGSMRGSVLLFLFLFLIGAYLLSKINNAKLIED